MKNKKNLNFIVLIVTHVPEHGAEQVSWYRSGAGAELERSNQKNTVLRSPDYTPRFDISNCPISHKGDSAIELSTVVPRYTSALIYECFEIRPAARAIFYFEVRARFEIRGIHTLNRCTRHQHAPRMCPD